MAKSKSKRATKRAAWRKCKGVNSRTGRVKKGFRVAKGGCPTPAIGKKARRLGRKIRYSTGSSYNRAAEAYFADKRQAEADWGRMASGINGLRGLSADVRRRIQLRRKKAWGRT